MIVAIPLDSAQAETTLLRALVPLLEARGAVAIGAGGEGFARQLVRCGYRPVHVVPCTSGDAELLRTRFQGVDLVAVHEPLDGRANTDPELVLAGTDMPAEVAVLRIDAGVANYAITEAAAPARYDLVLVRHWRELPGNLGKCPWSLDQIADLFERHGFANFVSIRESRQLATMDWNRARIDSGESAILAFINDRVVQALLPALLDAFSQAHDQLWGTARLVRAAAERSAETAAGLREAQEEVTRRITALADGLPAPMGAEEPADETSPTTAILEEQKLGEAVERLERRVHVRNDERERLLKDRKSSLRAWRWRAKRWREPRLGVLWQEEPRPLTVPRSYLRTTPPQPAPSISIVTPSFQQGQFLERTIGSVMTQRYPNLEYIVQDGGSSDETKEVLARNEHNLAHWESAPDGGQANAINLGFNRSSGEIMAYLNSDDILLPGSLAFIARCFEERPDIDVVYGHRIIIDALDRRVGLWVMPPHDDMLLMWADCIPQETLFWRRQIWDRAGGMIDESFRFAIDWELLLRFKDVGAKMVRVNRYLGAFRVHPEQKTTADRELGEDETRRLWRRCHGRDVDWDEALTCLSGYLSRHVLHHTVHRAIDRLPRRRTSLVHRDAQRPSREESGGVKGSVPLRVAVNLRQYRATEMGGMDVYVRHVLAGLAAGTEATSPSLTVFTVESQVDALRAFLPTARLRVAPDHRAGLSIEPEFDPDAYDALFCPLFVLDPMTAGIPAAVTLPDLQHEFFDQYLDPVVAELRRRLVRASVLSADRVFTLSEFSKRTITELYGVDEDKITVTYPGVDEEFREAAPLVPSEAFRKLGTPEDYLFYPASFLPHKNHACLLQALKLLTENGHASLGLVLSGVPGARAEWVSDEISRLGLTDRVCTVGFQPRDVSVELFRHARAVVFPSRFEGFGLPLVEAFHTRTPVIASRVGSCPEVAGDAAVYFDENDPADIAAAVEQVLTDAMLERGLRERGKMRSEQFSWERSIEVTIDALAAMAVKG